MLQYIAAGATAIVLVTVVWTAYAVMDGVYDNYTCEILDGYNPSGTTTAEMYPPDTWAGLCEKNESGAVTLYSVLAGIGAVALGGVFVAAVRAWRPLAAAAAAAAGGGGLASLRCARRGGGAPPPR